MAEDLIYAGAVGVPIRLILVNRGAVHDPTSATLREITLIKPGGVRVVKTGPDDVVVGEDSTDRPCLEYVSEEGDLAVAGVYKAIGYIEDSAGKWPAQPAVFRVHPSER